MNKTGAFIQSHLLEPCESCDVASFHYTGYREENEILCPDELSKIPEDIFSKTLLDFAQYAESHFFEAFERLNIEWMGYRKSTRQRQKQSLRQVGQEGDLL